MKIAKNAFEIVTLTNYNCLSFVLDVRVASLLFKLARLLAERWNDFLLLPLQFRIHIS